MSNTSNFSLSNKLPRDGCFVPSPLFLKTVILAVTRFSTVLKIRIILPTGEITLLLPVYIIEIKAGQGISLAPDIKADLLEAHKILGC